MSNFKKGDTLYRYVCGVIEYEVIGIRDNREGISLELLSKSCGHGWKCEILASPDDKGRLAYVCMLNNRDDDDQSYFHIDSKAKRQYFHTTREAAYKNKCDDIIEYNISEIDKLKSRIAVMEDRVQLAREFNGDKDAFQKAFCV